MARSQDPYHEFLVVCFDILLSPAPKTPPRGSLPERKPAKSSDALAVPVECSCSFLHLAGVSPPPNDSECPRRPKSGGKRIGDATSLPSRLPGRVTMVA
jgi:hypothetical protein